MTIIKNSNVTVNDALCIYLRHERCRNTSPCDERTIRDFEQQIAKFIDAGAVFDDQMIFIIAGEATGRWMEGETLSDRQKAMLRILHANGAGLDPLHAYALRVGNEQVRLWLEVELLSKSTVEASAPAKDRRI